MDCGASVDELWSCAGLGSAFCSLCCSSWRFLSALECWRSLCIAVGGDFEVDVNEAYFTGVFSGYYFKCYKRLLCWHKKTGRFHVPLIFEMSIGL